MSNVIFPSKINSATITVSFDFLNVLNPGEALTGSTVNVVVFSGTDASPNAILAAAESIVGTVIEQRVTAGVIGVTYSIDCTGSTNQGNSYILQGLLAVIDTDPY